eukprot:TRINITY_DN2880_c0_g1_i1.p1 TRINITY_DN2880_c0_g1~~TRINITY_DN2880_c0_g1_i1.p1  ORF type:complete len:373 (+),score=100.71 TRINITY_DN2880_c0_g1_i1:45-1163(+)
MGIKEKLAEIDLEMSRTQKNKATEHHLGRLKAQRAKLMAELIESQTKKTTAGDGFEAPRSGDARVAMIGFPSVGKSTTLTELTAADSKTAEYEFTTLTCIPGVFDYKGARIQLLDLPGIIDGAATNRGNGRRVISTARSADCVLMVLDASQGELQKVLLTQELAKMGIRLNQLPPDLQIVKKSSGGINIISPIPLTHLNDTIVKTILKEYKITNADITCREDCTVEQLIDVVVGNRVYLPCVYMYNKIDFLTIEEIDRLAKLSRHNVMTSLSHRLGIRSLLACLWEHLSIKRIYTKSKDERIPTFHDPLILTHEVTIRDVCHCIHGDMERKFNHAMVWGSSVKTQPSMCGIEHKLHDEDVVQIFIKLPSNTI